ncbi:hypothetical protein H8711_09845 [Clostridiaceae bacterium NSJ-31]|jgi:hypothetical protein|uniref:Uncharacterized protein n=1 Tax=Ligaoa zhengdingensis TaxID=2763658 RepID=A0A926DXT0_9FIRM|nr:hypothetical protein [Ligaoa zhengdingensis]MBC8547225.1 hypothetical protein [Ligaoa zhengdingensis]DAV16748.1 MAG TPA: NUDIX domain protein [Caudoviricetes sp.]
MLCPFCRNEMQINRVDQEDNPEYGCWNRQCPNYQPPEAEQIEEKEQ